MLEFGAYPIVCEGTCIKSEPDDTPSRDYPSDKNSSDFIADTARVKQEFILETEDAIHSGNQFLDYSQDEFREIKTENDTVASQFEAQCLLRLNSEESGVILCNEKNIKEEVFVDSFSVVGNQRDSGEKPYQTAECEEVARNSLNKLNRKINVRSSLSDFPHENNNISCTYFDQSEQSRIYYDSRIKLMNVSVALEDLFEKIPGDDSGRPVQRHINSKFCRCVFCTGKFKFQTLIENPVEIFINENNESLNFDLIEVVDRKNRLKNDPDNGLLFLSEQKVFPTDPQTTKTFKPFSCETCISAFKTLKELEQHLVIHSKKPFLCVYCHETFNAKRKLVRHLTIHTSIVKLFSCPSCDSAFKKLSDMTYHHFRCHSGARPFTCTQCGAAFKTNEELRRHCVVHSTEKPFSCPHPRCNAKFKRAREVTQHFPIHSSERRFSCSKCDGTFKRSRDVRRHMTSHIDVKPYSCADCGTFFKHRRHLQRHIAGFHSNKKRFSCPKCPAKFKYSKSQSKHLLMVHPIENRFHCGHCHAKFGRKVHIRRHIKKDHQNEIAFVK